MDQAFLEYYEEELGHIRGLAREFAALHPNVAANLQIETAPCPDPYVERLLEGVAFLAARTRLKVDAESSRYVRAILDTLYPDLAGPAPAMTMARLGPGPQVDRMVEGHRVRRGTRLVSGLREGLRTRCTYTTAQDVALWPIEVAEADYLQDPGALAQAGVPDAVLREAAAGLRVVLARTGPGALAELSLDGIDLYFGGDGRGGALFDAIHGGGSPALARPAEASRPFLRARTPQMVGVSDGEGLLPRVRASFEGYRLLREYFLMPERFHYARLSGLGPAVRETEGARLEIVLPLARARPELAEVSAADFELFVAPIVNLFEHECNLVEVAPTRSAHPVHADRARPRDFEIYRLLRVEDADADGPQARLRPLFSMENTGDSGHVYAVERRPRRPGEDELRRGQTRTSYTGDDVMVSLARPAGAAPDRSGPIRRLDIRALATNRDLPILDDTPTLTPEAGDPIKNVRLIRPVRPPRAGLRATLPRGTGTEAGMDDLTWRLVAQLSLDHVSLAAEEKDAEPLRALMQLYADRGDPALARHGRAISRVTSRPVMERLARPGPIAFGHGTEIRLEIDEQVLSGSSELLLSALLARLFERHTAINSFVRTTAVLTQSQTEVAWPMTPGTRALL